MNEMTVTRTRSEAFAERIGTLLDAGAVAAMISVGHRAGLFTALAGQRPETSDEIARRTGLAERYVREWLAVMVTGRIVDYDPAHRTYHLPEAHADCLVPGAALGNLAVYAQHVTLLGKLEDRIQHCLETGEGTGYSDYPCFHQIMAEDSDQTVKDGLFEVILPLVEGIDERLATGIEVLDAGCGRGHVLLALAERYPASRFTGYDLCADAIDHARNRALAAGLTNVTFEQRDLTGYSEPGRFDLVTSFDAVHDQKDPEGLIRGLKTSLKPGGVYLMQDIGGSAYLEKNMDFPMASLLYAISCAHCTPVSIGQGGNGLGTMWGWETAERMLEDAGFSSVNRHILPHDPMNVWFVSQV
ncbi:class I SAM-dependent methyltransferase [Roseibium sp.]|uniref:class I SAM-dependent methyltransferase n=1 Tax=Roseibium sp. TaxID=1936156 RepID=UPI003D0BA771